MATLRRPETVGDTFGDNVKRKSKSKSDKKSPEKSPLDPPMLLDSPSYVSHFQSLPSILRPSQFDENEERIYMDTETWNTRNVQTLIHSLLNWMNDILAPDRIVLTDIVQDLYDGVIIRRLLERLADIDFKYAPMSLLSLNKKEQTKRLNSILTKCAELLGPMLLWDSIRWTVEAISNKNAIVIVQLSVALAAYFRAPIPLLQQPYTPNRFQIRALFVKRRGEHLYAKEVTDDLIPSLSGMLVVNWSGTDSQSVRDAFDTLFDHAPEKLNAVKKSVSIFVNRYLNKLNVDITDLTMQFRDGVNLILLIGLLEGYFVPLYEYNAEPTEYDQKLKNIVFAFRLLEEAGMKRLKCKPEDVVIGDEKCILRMLFMLYNRYQKV